MDLEQLLQDKIDTRVFLDTCTLMHPKFEKFLAKVVPVLSLYGYKLVVPWSCIEELNKHKTNPKLKSKAVKALKELERIYQYVVSVTAMQPFFLSLCLLPLLQHY